MRLVAYCRVSTDKEEQLESLANQQVFFEKFAERNNHTLVKIYSDEGISGKQMKNRKGFLKLMQDAKLGLFDMVAVKDISRFARNTVDFLVSIRELKALNIEVQFVSINQTVLGNSEFILTMFSAIAQEESANLSSRVKFGKKINAKRGKVPNFIYGYDWVDRFTLKINEEQAEVVRRIFKMYTEEGLGARRIAIRLTEEGVPTLYQATRWLPKTIRRMLSNPIYKGTLISKKTEGVNYLTGERRFLEETGEYTFDKPELAIVDGNAFNAAGIRLEENQKIYKNKNPNGRVSSQYPFSTLIKCEHCHYSFSRRIANLKRGQVIRWKCSGRNVNNSAFCPNNTVIDEDELLDEITNYLYDKIKDKDKFIRTYESLEQEQVKQDEPAINIEEEISKLQAKKNKYMDMYVNEVIDITQLKQYVAQINGQIKDYQTKAVVTEDECVNAHMTAEESYQCIKEVLQGNYSNIALKKIIDVITVNKFGEIKIVWK